MRFRAEQHLRRQADIRAVREKGRRIECRIFTAWWKRREDSAPAGATPPRSRVCVIASSKAVGAAVQRNRAKRRLREVYRLRQEQVPAGCDLLLIAREAVTRCPQPELEQRFTAMCEQIGTRTSSGSEPRP